MNCSAEAIAKFCRERAGIPALRIRDGRISRCHPLTLEAYLAGIRSLGGDIEDEIRDIIGKLVEIHRGDGGIVSTGEADKISLVSDDHSVVAAGADQDIGPAAIEKAVIIAGAPVEVGAATRGHQRVVARDPHDPVHEGLVRVSIGA